MELIKDLLILILPSLLTAVFSYLGIDKIKFQRYQRLIEIAEEAVLYADDYYPESPGVDKLKEAIEYFKTAAQKAGFWVSDKEAEEKVRISSTAETSTEQFSEAVGGGVIRREVKERLLPEGKKDTKEKSLARN